MRDGRRWVVLLMAIVGVSIALFFGYIFTHQSAVFSPAGLIAHQQRQLMIVALLLSLVVIIPVFAMLFVFAWKYRASNTKAAYAPNWSGSARAETVWWGVPILLILILSVITWQSSHSLDPFRPISSEKRPLTIQVVALQWRWLFLYPEQNVATINEVALPVDRPVHFEITSDAPMNSFWIPRLGGQIYAMSGMSTELYLMADQVGTYQGVSANLSGEGFAGMRFQAKSMTNADFNQWLLGVRNSGRQLDRQKYDALAAPSHQSGVQYFWSYDSSLYGRVIDKYMTGGKMTGHGMMMHMGRGY